jgi:hypothetical protein
MIKMLVLEIGVLLSLAFNILQSNATKEVNAPLENVTKRKDASTLVLFVTTKILAPLTNASEENVYLDLKFVNHHAVIHV